MAELSPGLTAELLEDGTVRLSDYFGRIDLSATDVAAFLEWLDRPGVER